MSQELEFLSHLIIGRAIRVHRRLGPGLLESVYHTVFCHDLRSQGLYVESKRAVSFEMDGHWFENAFVADLVVERCIVIEVKSAITMHPVFAKQLLTYMRLLNCKLGFLLNFNTALMRDGIKRMVNNL